MRTAHTESVQNRPWIAAAIAVLAVVALAGCGSSSSTGTSTGGSNSGSTYGLTSVSTGSITTLTNYVEIPVTITVSGSPQYAVVTCSTSCSGSSQTLSTAGAVSGTSLTVTLAGTVTSTGGTHVIDQVDLFSTDASATNWSAMYYLQQNSSDADYSWINASKASGNITVGISYTTGGTPVGTFTY